MVDCSAWGVLSRKGGTSISLPLCTSCAETHHKPHYSRLSLYPHVHIHAAYSHIHEQYVVYDLLYIHNHVCVCAVATCFVGFVRCIIQISLNITVDIFGGYRDL